MARTQREQNILTILPATLLVIVYAFSFSRHPELTQVVASLETARATAVSLGAVETERNVLEKLNSDHGVLKEQYAKLLTQKSKVMESQGRDPAARAGAMRRATQILWANGLTMISESQTEESQGILPEGLQAAVRKLSTSRPPLSSTNPSDPRIAASQAESSALPIAEPNNPRIWAIKFYGRYENVVSALEKLAKRGEGSVPIGLSMEPTHENADRWHKWTLTLWL